MLEKLKTGIKWVGVPLLLIFGFISYLLSRVNSLKGEVRRKEAESKMSTILNDLGRAKNEADTKETNFDESYNTYLAARAKHLRDSGDKE